MSAETRSASFDHEKVSIRVAGRNYTCHTFAEWGVDSWQDPPCQRAVAKGDEYIVSTIYPGHDSGYADGGWNRDGDPVPPRPFSTRSCMACGQRWTNLRERLALIAEPAS